MFRTYCVVFALVLNVNCQYLQSPCPGLFDYQTDGNGIYGLIQLTPNGGPVSSVHLRANFTVAARLPTTYVGQIQTIGSGDHLLQNFNKGVPLQYRIDFPLASPIPKLTAIEVNGETRCYGNGDIVVPNQYVTMISLDHMLYLKPGTGSNFFQYEPRPGSSGAPIVDIISQFAGDKTPVYTISQNGGDNTQVYTFNDLDDRNGGWSTGYFPIEESRPASRPVSRPNVYEHTVTRPPRPPVYEQPQMRPPQSPVYEQPQTRPPQTQIYEQPQTRPPQSPVYEQPQSMPPRPRPVATRPRPEYMYPVQTTEAAVATPPPPPTVPAIQPQPSRPSMEPVTPIECGVIAGGNERVPLIYNGNAYPRGEWPWLVAVYKRQEGSLTFICSGTLVSDRHVISAAHCMQQKSKISTIKDIVIKVGVYNLEDWGDDSIVTRTLLAAAIHDSYNATTLENDILVFTLERTVEFTNYIRPACLWSGNTDLSRIVGASGVVAGWGASEVGPVGQGEPRMVRIPIVSTAQCRASKPEFHKLTSSKTLCAGDRNGAGPCLGDSGGGLYILDGGRWRIRGVVSLSLRPTNGDTTCNLNEYIVFTDTAQYLSWIRKVLSQNFYDH